MDTLHISSDKVFYSIQGEGPTTGVPAVFLRVAGCVLDCQFCDTAAVWKNSTPMTFDEVFSLLEPHIPRLDRGAHLILTGGSPLRQQKALAQFLNYVEKVHPAAEQWYVECETEGVLAPDELMPWVNQWNVSPKLSNSGMEFHRRFKPDTLRTHVTHGSACYKFPIDTNLWPAAVIEQIAEIAAICAMCGINKRHVWLMPVCADRETHDRGIRQVYELAKEHGYCASARMHLLVWNQVTGV